MHPKAVLGKGAVAARPQRAKPERIARGADRHLKSDRRKMTRAIVNNCRANRFLQFARPVFQPITKKRSCRLRLLCPRAAVDDAFCDSVVERVAASAL
jgi:hypothetical protein